MTDTPGRAGRLQLAEEIREARLRKGLTQEEAARLAGVDRKHFWKLERGKSDVTLETFQRVVTSLEMEKVTLGPVDVLPTGNRAMRLKRACEAAMAALAEVRAALADESEEAVESDRHFDRVVEASRGAQPLTANHPTVRALDQLIRGRTKNPPEGQ